MTRQPGHIPRHLPVHLMRHPTLSPAVISGALRAPLTSPLTPPPLPRTPHLLTAREQALSAPTLRLTSLSLSQRRCR